MILPFDLPQVFLPNTDTAENAESLVALLEALVSQNEVYRRYHTGIPFLYDSGVIYGRTDEWMNIPACRQRGYADCKSLTAWLISDYRHVKRIPAKPVFRWVYRNGNQKGPKDFHILVQTKYGFEDPSRKLGMNGNSDGW